MYQETLYSGRLHFGHVSENARHNGNIDIMIIYQGDPAFI